MQKTEFAVILNDVKLIDLLDLNSNYKLSNFKAKYEEYDSYLKNHAHNFQKQKVSHTHVLVNTKTFDVIAYMTLLTDSISLLPKEKDHDALSDVPYSTLPALKIGKLAVDEAYCAIYRGIGSTMIQLARGFAQLANMKGIACRYLTTDADIENNPTIVSFYKKCGFLSNERINNRNRKTISMRNDIFFN